MLLEAVPNISLGPQDEAINEVLSTVRLATSPGCCLLDVHTDPDHRRTVLTLAGAPVPLVEVLTHLTDALAKHGTLRGHDGVHPRVGLLDVLPFVNLEGPSSQAHRAAERIMARLAARGIPTYAYAHMAQRSRTRRLARIRSDVDGCSPGQPLPLAPDAGPPSLHETMGATCVGVRDPLVAYNVLLDTRDLDQGRSIAAELRGREGGLPGLQTLAFPLASRGDRIQVSTNLTDTDQLELADIYAAVERQADARGITTMEGELVGLAPSTVLPARPDRLGMEQLPPSLEEALEAAGLARPGQK